VGEGEIGPRSPNMVQSRHQRRGGARSGWQGGSENVEVTDGHPYRGEFREHDETGIEERGGKKGRESIRLLFGILWEKERQKAKNRGVGGGGGVGGVKQNTEKKEGQNE